MNSLDFWRKPSGYDNFDQMMDNFLRGDLMPSSMGLSRKGLSAACELSETADSYFMKFDLPGLKKEDIKIDLSENRITVSGERKEEHKEKDKKNRTQYSEVSYGSFSRSYSFPTPVDANKVDAKYTDGVLTISVGKSADTQARQIAIQ
jgi:HSP20 family protein